MVGLYIGSTTGYSGKNLVAMALGLKLQKDGLNVGYMKPVGAMPKRTETSFGDEDAFFILDLLGLKESPELVTPVVVTRDFKVKAFTSDCGNLMAGIVSSYNTLSKDKDVMLVGGSGSFLYSGKYCGVDGPTVAAGLGCKVILIDRYHHELNYDYLVACKEVLGDDLLGVILNDIPEGFMQEANDLVKPFLERRGVDVLGIVPADPLLNAIRVDRLAERLGGKVISVSGKSERLVEDFIIGTMHVENFLTHFKRKRNVAVIVGGDRSDLQLVAMEGNCSCLVLTGNLYPNDIILTRSEVLGIPVIAVRDDTYSVSKKMEQILGSQKLRDMMKVNHGTQVIMGAVDFQALKSRLGF